MTINAFAISRRLVEKGMNKQTADAIAEEIVTHSNERLATKEGVARVEAKVSVLETKINVLVVLNVGLLITVLADKLIG